MSDEYVDGDDYRELFTKFVLNISAEDLENITFDYVDVNTTENQRVLTIPTETDSDWTIVLNIISGFGILTNSILLFMVVVDLVLDKHCRKKSRHWLVFHASIIHILYLVNAISLNGMALDVFKNRSHFKIWIHLANTFEFMVNLNLVIFGLNVIFRCFKPHEDKGFKHLCFWGFLVILTWLIGNLVVYRFVTSEVSSQTNSNDAVAITPLRVLVKHGTTLFTIMFALPYVISIIVLLTSIMFRAMKLRYTKASSATNYSDNGIEADAILFLSILIIVGLFTIAPYFIFRLSDVYRIPTNNIHVYYSIVLLDIVFYVAFPLVTLSLRDIRHIFHKLISTTTSDSDCIELDQI